MSAVLAVRSVGAALGATPSGLGLDAELFCEKKENAETLSDFVRDQVTRAKKDIAIKFLFGDILESLGVEVTSDSLRVHTEVSQADLSRLADFAGSSRALRGLGAAPKH
jgi:hypothetical protein